MLLTALPAASEQNHPATHLTFSLSAVKKKAIFDMPWGNLQSRNSPPAAGLTPVSVFLHWDFYSDIYRRTLGHAPTLFFFSLARLKNVKQTQETW